MIMRTFRPKKIQNLYDARLHSHFDGVLLFPESDSKSSEERTSIKELNEFPINIKALEFNEENSTDHIVEKEDNIFIKFAFKVDAIVFPYISKFYKKIIVLKDVVIDRAELIDLKNKSDNKRLDYLNNQNTFGNESVLKRTSFVFGSISFRTLQTIFALCCLLFSFISIGLLIAPLFFAQFGQSFQFSHPTPIPTATPYVYSNYYQPEKNSLYPITEFKIVVPKINLESEIVNNVDTNLEDEYKNKLQFGVAHAKGSYLPPEIGGPVYLFAHSTDTVLNIARFNAKFYSVRELENGDEINVFFNGKKYVYKVKDKFIINPKEVDVVKNAETDLILQTCWPPGTDWQRLIIYADKADVEEQTI